LVRSLSVVIGFVALLVDSLPEIHSDRTIEEWIFFGGFSPLPEEPLEGKPINPGFNVFS